MQLTEKSLEEQLSKKKLSSCYLLCSTNAFLLQEMKDAIWQVAFEKGFANRQKWEIYPKYDWGPIKHQNNGPDLSHRSLIELRCIKPLDIATASQLEKFIQQSQTNSFTSPIMVISYEKWSYKLQKAAWFQKLSVMSTVTVLYTPSIHQLPYWLTKALQRFKLTLTQEAMANFIQAVEGNLSAAKQIIKKLSLLYGNAHQPISVEKLHVILENETIFDLSHLTEAILQKDLDKCLRILQYLESIQMPSPLVLGSLLKLLRIVSGLRYGLDHKQNINELFQQYGVWEKQQLGFKKMVESLSSDTIASLFTSAYKAERCIKGVYAELSWLYLQQLTFCLAGCTTPFLKMLSQY